MTASRVTLFAIVLASACRPTSPSTTPPPPQDPPPVDAAPAADARPISMVTSAIVVESCPDSKLLSTKLASKEIHELVGPCTHVPAGEVQFSARFHPDGRIELGAPSHDPAAGMVPTCVVQNAKQIRHRLKLTSPCTVDVTLNEHG